MKRFIPLLALLGCTGPDVAPTIAVRSPGVDAVLGGFATISAVFAVEDDSNAEVTVEYVIDELDPVRVTGDGCARGCTITAQIDTAELEDGPHTISATVEDVGGQSGDSGEPQTFTVHDVPFVSSLAVLDTEEGPLNGPNIEVEVHLLNDETAEWLGCAAMEEVQQDNVLYDELAVAFQSNEAGNFVPFMDVGFDVVRVVVIESDNNEHCPVWPALTETLESDVDDLYGISPPLDMSLLFSGPVDVAVPGTTGLVLDRGRPFGTQ